MLNIFYVNLITFDNAGGIENFNKTFLKALSQIENVKATSVSVYDSADKKNIIKGVEFQYFHGNKYQRYLRVLKYLIFSLRRIDILILAHIHLIPIALIIKILRPNLKIYLNAYGIEVWRIMPFFYRLFLKNIRIFSISTYTTDTLIKFNPYIKKEQFFYLPPDTDMKVHQSLESPYEVGKYNLLTVSRLTINDRYKGVDSMIKTLPLIINKIQNIKYFIIGEGNDRGRLEELVDKLGLREYVEFKGFVDQLEVYYEYCDVFALPSKGEGFGIVYIEAMKYHKPCIACNVGGATDVVIADETGLTCDYDDQQSLASSILTFYENRKLAKKYGENGHKHLLKNFTFDKFKNRLLLEFKEDLSELKFYESTNKVL
tara:strand:- start:81 stop:1199 length:1119 start_codon:yes stop_codon:yes gene_type:complete